MIVLVCLNCDVCGGTAGIGVNVEHAEFNVTESGGRFIANLRVCRRCAKVTR